MQPLRARPDQLARQRATDVARRIGNELRIARVTAGLPQTTVARRAGTSQATVSRAERGLLPLDLETLVRIATAVGHDLSLRLFPRERVRLRDSGQLVIAQLIVAAAHPSWRALLEQPVAAGDPRAADLVMDRVEEVAHLEIERALSDLQAQLRAGLQKRDLLAQRERRPVRFILVLPDSAHSRAAVAPHALLIHTTLPIPSREICARIRHGRPIGGDGLLWVRMRDLRRQGVTVSHSPREYKSAGDAAAAPTHSRGG